MKVRMLYNAEFFGNIVRLEGTVDTSLLYKVAHFGAAKEGLKALVKDPKMKTYTFKQWTIERID